VSRVLTVVTRLVGVLLGFEATGFVAGAVANADVGADVDARSSSRSSSSSSIVVTRVLLGVEAPGFVVGAEVGADVDARSSSRSSSSSSIVVTRVLLGVEAGVEDEVLLSSEPFLAKAGAVMLVTRIRSDPAMVIR
jgi:hypothetical protein